jgi:hypothetical protein
MLKVDVHTDLDEVKQLWMNYWPRRCLFDLWPVRACFQAQFNHTPYFIVARQNGKFRGLLALSWIDEEQSYGHFPGETWHGKTWLEQNKIIADDPEICRILLSHIPAASRIRYLTLPSYLVDDPLAGVDEVGYLFYPQQYGGSFQNYRQSFSGKSRKKIRCELNRLTAGGVSYRYDRFADVEHLFRMNLENFSEQSYFSDPRFLRSFENLAAWLHASGLLRVTTVLIGGRIAAVDIGAVWGSTYTVLAGGTHADFPGVAKLINFHHIEWACQQDLMEVDFLCGDFNWKNRFHLTPRPLYEIMLLQTLNIWQDAEFSRNEARAC